MQKKNYYVFTYVRKVSMYVLLSLYYFKVLKIFQIYKYLKFMNIHKIILIFKLTFSFVTFFV
jgi:hypothetical protein